MRNKMITAQEAAAMIHDGDFLMVGGFMGHGSPDSIIQALLESGVKDLVVASNDTGVPEGMDKHGFRGLSEMIAQHRIKTLYATPIGLNPETGRQMSEGSLEVHLIPQGTFAERIRCAGFGLGGVLTPTGIGTDVANGKQVITVDGKDYLLETPLRGDIALIRGSVVDTMDNVCYKGTTNNFNSVMAKACKTVIVEAEGIVEPGQIAPEHVMTPFVCVDYIVKGGKN